MNPRGEGAVLALDTRTLTLATMQGMDTIHALLDSLDTLDQDEIQRRLEDIATEERRLRMLLRLARQKKEDTTCRPRQQHKEVPA